MDIMEWLVGAGNFFTVIVSAIVTWAGCFLFYRQRKDSMEIENESKQSEEWRKLYLDSQEDSRRKDAKIDDLRKDMNKMNFLVISLERRVQLNSIYRCDRTGCTDRFRKDVVEDEYAQQAKADEQHPQGEHAAQLNEED